MSNEIVLFDTSTRTLLVQNCSNQPHTLTLIPEGGSLGLSAFVVHTPPKL